MMQGLKKVSVCLNLLLILGLGSALIAGCSSKTVNQNDPQALLKDAEEDIKDKRYLQATEKLRTIKNRFPYSNVATVAALRVADVLFYEESFGEAAATYENFRDLHPKHERADYVIFQIGESYYRQLPGTIDRDLSPAKKAIESFEELQKLYPSSQYVAKAKERIQEATEQLAEKEAYIGDFYYKRDMYDSAATRYEKIAKNFQGTKAEERAYIRWAESLANLNKTDEAKHVYNLYLSRFPNGEYSKKAARHGQPEGIR